MGNYAKQGRYGLTLGSLNTMCCKRSVLEHVRDSGDPSIWLGKQCLFKNTLDIALFYDFLLILIPKPKAKKKSRAHFLRNFQYFT